MKILIVGGGTAGLISALILKKRLNLQVDVVHSKNIGIVGVGEGSTEHFKDFMEFVGIDQYSLIKECDATYKGGILFSGWSDKDYMHNVSVPFNNSFAQYPYVYSHQICNGRDKLNSKMTWDSRISKYFINQPSDMPYNQFHFNTFKLNSFLINQCKLKEINIFEDDIEDVILNNSGEIDYLLGKENKYDYDFYIDSTGFRRVLMSKLGYKWESFKDYLKMKSAITFQTEDTENYNLWTLSKAMDYGWMFRIPVWGRHGNGYIYDSDYISQDEAKKELDIMFNRDIEIGRTFNFDPGCLDRVWIKNCVAVGLSAMFVEPLEATSIGTTIQQIFLLMHRISNYDEKTIETYNNEFKDISLNIRDFIYLHYMTNKNTSKFWEDVSKIEIPDTLKEKFTIWDKKIPIIEDFNKESRYILFSDHNFIVVMSGLNLINIKEWKKEYDMLPDFVKNDAENIVLREEYIENNYPTVSHKEFIKIIRDYL